MQPAAQLVTVQVEVKVGLSEGAVGQLDEVQSLHLLQVGGTVQPLTGGAVGFPGEHGL